MRKAIFAAAVALAVVSVHASAQERGAYIGGAFGQSSVNFDAGQLASDLASVGLTNTGVSVDETDVTWRGILGYRINRNFALEGSYGQLGEFTAHTTVTAVSGTPIAPTGLDIKFKVTDTFTLSALGIVPLNDRFEAFGRLGMYRTKVEFVASALSTASTSTNDSDLLFGVGVGYHITRQLQLRAEWQRYSKVGDEEQTGEGDVDTLTLG